MKVGDTIWRFNGNRRIYQKGQSAPVWREHWEPRLVIGQTTRSWLVGYEYKPTKVPKHGADPRVWAFSEAELDRLAWVMDNRHQIARRVDTCYDYDTLQAIHHLLAETVTR